MSNGFSDTINDGGLGTGRSVNLPNYEIISHTVGSGCDCWFSGLFVIHI